ncbi:LpxL/LpxP family acyltransferase [Methylobacter sp.]|uniref:LpxL/LpxP family acyltransferase n=1 Tax=Methylobacter sp. TaxID=2051955 RepID=UPI002FDD25B8
MSKPLHWSGMGEWSLIWGMRFLLRVYLLFGRTVLQWFLYPVVSYYWLVNKPGREASQAYLKRVAKLLPESGLSGNLLDSHRHFISFANAIIDKLAAWSGALSRADVSYQGRNELLAQIKTGRGAILLGSHLGNLEVCRVIADLDDAPRINVLVHTKHAEKFNRLLKQTNRNSGLNLIQVTEINAASAMLLSDKIDNGELVIITADRTPVSRNPRVSRTGFLGDDALFPQGPFILASLLKCPVYTLFCLKQQGKQVIYFEHFSDKLTFPRKTREQALQQTIQRYAQRLEHYCLMEPLQWFNFFDFWHLVGKESDEQ